MTNATGLREAAERLNEYVTREIDIFSDEAAELDEDMGEELRQVLKDTATVSKHILATHPSDGGEAITKEMLLPYVANESNRLVMRRPRGQELEFVAVSEGYEVWTDGLLCVLETRDDLRHLLAALGCATKGTENPGNS